MKYILTLLLVLVPLLSENSFALPSKDFFCTNAPQAMSFYHNSSAGEGYCSVTALCVYAGNDKDDATQKSEKDLVDEASGGAEKMQVLAKKHGYPPNICAPPAPTDWFTAFLTCPSTGWLDGMTGLPITDANKISKCMKYEHIKVLPKPCYRACPAPQLCKESDPTNEQEIAIMTIEDSRTVMANPTGIFKVTPAEQAKP